VSQWYANSGKSGVMLYELQRTWDLERREARKEIRVRRRAWSNTLHVEHVGVAIKEMQNSSLDSEFEIYFISA
jgi:hypothetical protein